jgi:formate dehydrogenase maturation protein FdhE
MPHDLDRRLEALEIRLAPRCPVCGDAPYRATVTDAITGEMVLENRPLLCPACGSRPDHGRTIVLEDDGDGMATEWL